MAWPRLGRSARSGHGRPARHGTYPLRQRLRRPYPAALPPVPAARRCRSARGPRARPGRALSRGHGYLRFRDNTAERAAGPGRVGRGERIYHPIQGRRARGAAARQRRRQLARALVLVHHQDVGGRVGWSARECHLNSCSLFVGDMEACPPRPDPSPGKSERWGGCRCWAGLGRAGRRDSRNRR